MWFNPAPAMLEPARPWRYGLLLLWWAVAAGPVLAQDDQPRGHRGANGSGTFFVSVPVHPADGILVRPEAHSATLSVLEYSAAEGYVEYGPVNAPPTHRLPVRPFTAGTPAALKLDGLPADSACVYRFYDRAAADRPFVPRLTGSFHTARASGEAFRFTLTADAHLDEHTSPEVYAATLADIRTEQPDFHIDLGNLFMTDKHATRAEAARQYLAQRYYLGLIGTTVPVLLALGVHDGESSRYDDGTANCLAVWSGRWRMACFPDPVPDEFYSGNASRHPLLGWLQDYYSWTWGDALFVVLDPYRYSTHSRGKGDGWDWSLGTDQYRWLAQTLAGSQARFKFVLLHNLLAGDQASRGGVEIARFNEWGGKNSDGSDGFAAHRPGWDLPVHELLRRERVTAVFRAHDNFYARQQLDGILYLMVPQPSFAGDDRIRDLKNYGYVSGVFRGNSGHVLVSVGTDGVTVDYVRSGSTKGTASLADHFVVPAAGH
jgi:hypothetical protein